MAGSANFHFCETGCLYHRRQPSNVVFHHAMAQHMTHQGFQKATRGRLEIHDQQTATRLQHTADLGKSPVFEVISGQVVDHQTAHNHIELVIGERDVLDQTHGSPGPRLL
jgi:hypothetical protein